MNCAQCEELLGAYALDALPPDELAAVRDHLATCPEHAAKATELRNIAALLPESVEPLEPPATLRARVTSAIAATPQAGSPPLPMDIHGVKPANRSTAGRPPTQYLWGAIAAVLLLVVAGLLAWNISLQSNSSSSPDVLAVHPLTQDSGATGGFLVIFAGNEATVVGSALPRLDDSQVYQLWAISDDGATTSVGLMGYDDRGVPTASMPLSPGAAAAIAITVEPAGGSEQPSSPPLYTAET